MNRGSRLSRPYLLYCAQYCYRLNEQGLEAIEALFALLRGALFLEI